MKRSRTLLLLVAVILIGIYAVYRYMYQPHATTYSQDAAFEGYAEAFISEVTTDSQKWQNSIIQIEGVVSQITNTDFVINDVIFCQPESAEALQGLSEGMTVIVKGRFIGYDDLLEEIKMDKCIIIK